jgi:predicted PurR-regulated permease PerM
MSNGFSPLQLNWVRRHSAAKAGPSTQDGLRNAVGAMMRFGDHVRTTGGALKNWAIAQLQDSLAVGALWLIGLYILHVPLAPMWAVIAAVLQIVPQFGPILGLVGPVLATTIKWMDWEHPLEVLGLYAVIAVLDGLVLQPYIMRRTVKVPVWASVISPIVLGIIWPFWGVLAAPPLLAIIYAYRVRRRDAGRHPAPDRP